jgi:hypothetical protein
MKFWIPLAIILQLVMGFYTESQAQTKEYKNTISGGYGFPSILRLYLRATTTRDEFTIQGWGPYMVKYERKLNRKWGVGVNGSYSFSRLSFMADGFDTATKLIRLFEYGYELEEISFSIRANYHFHQSEKTDFYAGLGAGYGRIWLGTYTEAPVNKFSVSLFIPKPVSLEATAGMRYYPNKHIGIYTEVGLGKSWLLLKRYFIPEAVIQGGVCFRF